MRKTHHECSSFLEAKTPSFLQAEVTENSLREVFHSCGQLDEVIFRGWAGPMATGDLGNHNDDG